MEVQIKICGITTLADAEAAMSAGADALGFMFYSASPRYLAPGAAADIIARVPPTIAAVGVFVDPSPGFVRAVIGRTGISTLQFHGNETPAFCAQFGAKTIKAFRLRDRAALAALMPHRGSAWLLDSYVPDVPGGSGKTFNWDLAIEARRLGNPIFLAGGLNPENIGEAIRRVAPYGVDVSSGVEAAPGRKDPARLERFIGRARATAAEIAVGGQHWGWGVSAAGTPPGTAHEAERRKWTEGDHAQRR
jgi:phosphoribosylanthranilate isomerase